MTGTSQTYRAVSGQDDHNDIAETMSLHSIGTSGSDDDIRAPKRSPSSKTKVDKAIQRSPPRAGEHQEFGIMKKKQSRRGGCARLLPSKRICIFLSILLALVIAAAAAAGTYVYKHAPKDGLSPPWYPTPRGGTMKKWEESYEKARVMVEKMSIVEKVNITTGTG